MNSKIALAAASVAALVAGSVAVAQTYGQDPNRPTTATQSTQTQGATPRSTTMPTDTQTGTTQQQQQQPGATPRNQTGATTDTTTGATTRQYQATDPALQDQTTETDTRMMTDGTVGTDVQRAGERG